MEEKSIESENSELKNIQLSVGDFIREFIHKAKHEERLSEFKDFENKIYSEVKLHNEKRRKDLMRDMSAKGWFPSPVIFWKKIKDNEDIDSYMERCLTGEIRKITQTFYSRHPNRKIILEEAFKLFGEERYIAAIPLFISQIDGLSEDKNHAPFFSNDPKVDVRKLNDGDPRKFTAVHFPKFLGHVLNNSVEEVDPKQIEYYADVIANAASTFIADRTPKVDITNEIKILNRNGIMHGHKDFLSYGTRINALKVISLLLFVDHILILIHGDQ